MITKLNHIAIAVKSLEDHVPFYRDSLGLKFLGFEEVPEQKVKIAMFETGDVKIELLEPISEDSPINKFLQKNGDGIHHIAFQCDDIENQILDLVSKNITMIDDKPRSGAHGSKIAFVHPKSSGKILVELTKEQIT